MGDTIRVLFLCTGNSCRSQMAEGICRHLHAARIDVESAGIEKHGLNQNAVRVMKEIGIDISAHRSKTLNDLGNLDFDFVVTVCGHADESCPVFPDNTKVIHRGFDDPPKLAALAKTNKEALEHYRRVRDEIADYVRSIPETLPES